MGDQYGVNKIGVLVTVRNEHVPAFLSRPLARRAQVSGTVRNTRYEPPADFGDRAAIVMKFDHECYNKGGWKGDARRFFETTYRDLDVTIHDITLLEPFSERPAIRRRMRVVPDRSGCHRGASNPVATKTTLKFALTVEGRLEFTA